MAKKTTQSVKDRLAGYKKKLVRRSFFDELSADAQQFLVEIRELHRSNELDLKWSEVRDACCAEFPDDPWPTCCQTIARWIVKGQ